ncbi:MAG: DNA-directed RNA polymerase subunit omega [Syntrophaceae bacterium]|nr:DNA-directed RNA polymerase subunit omega [Syntrophaceae bacterium]
MARITIEDALENAQTRFGLVMLTAQRARQLLKGSAPLADIRNNREIVAALREIAAGKVNYSHPEFLKGAKEDFKPIPDDTEFIGDEDYAEPEL